MKKIIVIGCPGAGKSYFSKKLHKKLNIPLYHLDMIWHKPDRTNISKVEFDERLRELYAEDEWILDGNYTRTLKERLEVCDTIFFLDYPLSVCLEGARSRVGKKNRDDLPWIEEEFDEEFRQYIEAFPNNQLQEIYALLELYGQSKVIYRFQSRDEAKQFLEHVADKPTM